MEFTTGTLDPEAELTTRDARWQLWAGTSIDRPVWYATASTDTPVALLTAVTQCVADPAPLPRWREATFSYIKGMAQLTPILPPVPPAPTPLDVQRAVGPAARLRFLRPASRAGAPPADQRCPEPAADHPLARPTGGIRLTLYAREFFMEHLKLPFTDAAVVGNTYFAIPIPGGPLRLRIDFSRAIVADTYGGLRLATIHQDKGELDAVALRFEDHKTFDHRDATLGRRPREAGYGTIYDYRDRPDFVPWKGAHTLGLRDAIEQYTAVWFPGAWTASSSSRGAGTAHTAPAVPVARSGARAR